MYRVITFFLAMLAALQLTGCTVFMVVKTSFTELKASEDVQLNDNIHNAFKYEDLNIVIDSKGGKSYITLPYTGVGLVGDKNLYFLTKGGEELLRMEKLNERFPLSAQSRSANSPIHFDLAPDDGTDVNGRFSKRTQLTVNKSSGALTAREISLLKMAGFYYSAKKYRKDFDIEGIIIDRKRLKEPLGEFNRYTMDYPIQFSYATNSTQGYSRYRLTNPVQTPVKLTGDMVIIRPLTAIKYIGERQCCGMP